MHGLLLAVAMSLLIDGSFEIGDPAWTFVEYPYTNRDQEHVHTGAWAAKLDPYPVGGQVRQDFVAVPGQSYTISVWYYRETAEAPDIHVTVDNGLGNAQSWSSAPSVAGAWTQMTCGPYVAPSAGLQLLVSGGPLWEEPPEGTPAVWVDDVAIEAVLTEATMIEQIRTALASKLGGISTDAGYNTDPGIVTSELKPAKDYGSYPALVVRFIGLDSIVHDKTPLNRVYRVGFFNILQITKETDYTENDTDDLTMDVVKAIETDQTLGGLTYLQAVGALAVMVERTDAWDVPERTTPGFRMRTSVVRVTYQSPRGVA